MARRKPAVTAEARESELVARAYDEIERRLDAGTISSQLLSILLKTGSSREKSERNILSKQEELITAKTDSIKYAQSSDEIAKEAIAAIKSYRSSEEYDYDDY